MKLKSMDDLPSVRQYLKRIGAEIRSMRTAVIKEQHGSYWRDVAVIKLNKDGSVVAPSGLEPSEAEQLGITHDTLGAKWPSVQPLLRIENPPDDIKNANQKDIFEFRDRFGMIQMVQVRKNLRDGGKAYIPWTYWDDGEWRPAEPDGPLPLFGMDKVGENTTVFIHEGAKAARAMQRMVDKETANDAAALAECPWGLELSGAAHIGWIGGALSPHRTDWSVLKDIGVSRAYIVSDNDPPGVAAVPAIAFHLKITCFHVQFTSEWPVSFDLADQFPSKMFRELEGKRRYIGPAFRACLHPATWATDQIPQPNGKGRPVTVLRDNFKDAWAYVEEADIFVCSEMPEIMRNSEILNNMLAPFSHVQDTARLIVKAYSGRSAKLCYRPDVEGRNVTDKTTSAINLHTKSNVRGEEGDPKPFLDFVEYMFPNDEEREHVLKWMATLISRPKIRMHYGLLLVSEAQGIGKTTLGSNILAPLVGVQNCAWPAESEIVNSDFNDWLAHKRLLVVNEIYSGHSWKAYNKLKSVITDSEVQVNQKYQRRYIIENWAHVIACSNSKRALRIEGDDRRWFYPEVAEYPWPHRRFEMLREWLESGGLGIIKTWAERYGSYVQPGERAPMTERKKELIEGSRSEGQQEAVDMASAMLSYEGPIGIAMKAIVFAVRAAVQGKVFDSDYELRKAMTDAGLRVWPKRLKIGGRLQYVMVNTKLWESASAIDDEAESCRFVMSCVKQPSDVLEGAM